MTTTTADVYEDFQRFVQRYSPVTTEEAIDLCKAVQTMNRWKGEPETPKLAAIVRAGERAKDLMVKSNLRLVIKIAKRYQGLGLELMDLIQEGTIGLTEAISSFDTRRGLEFSTHAWYQIRHRILRAVRLRGRLIRIPIAKQDMMYRVKEFQRSFVQEKGRHPDLAETAVGVETSPEKLLTLLQMFRPHAYLDAPQSWKGEDCGTLGDIIPDPKSETDPIGDIDLLNRALATLTLENQRLIVMLFGLGGQQSFTGREAARQLGVSPMTVTLRKKAALTQLRLQLSSHQEAVGT